MTEATLPEQSRESKQVASYSGSRPDVCKHVRSPKTVLDVGCNEGALARSLKQRFPNVQIWGIDINADAIRVANDVLEAGYCLNLDNPDELETTLKRLTFDTIIAADVLEHTVNPWKVFRFFLTRLNGGGEILVSLPNFGHWETMVHLMLQKFPRRSRGLYDDTHLRFFLCRNLSEFQTDSTRMRIVQRNFRLWERRGTPVDPLIRFALGWLPWVREFFVFQYIIRVEKLPD